MHVEAAGDGGLRRARASAKHAPFLEAEEERWLLARAAHDPRALSILIESHMRLVIGIAQRYVRDGVAADDLIAEGTIGLLEAIRRFDDAAEGRLSTYAKWWIRARVRAYSLANRRLVALPSTRAARLVFARLATTERNLTQALGRPPARDELAEALGVPREELDAVVQALSADLRVSSEEDALLVEPADPAATPEQAFADAEQRTHVEHALQRTRPELSLRQRDVFDAHFAQDEHAPLCEIAKTLGVSRQRVSQIATEIRERVHKNLRDGLPLESERGAFVRTAT